MFEIRQRITEPALTSHDGCGGAVRRLLSAAPFILKGDGWYVTDYPSESRKKAMSSEKGADAKSDSATKADSSKADSSTKSDSSSASSTESKPAAPTTSSAGASSSSSSTPST